MSDIDYEKIRERRYTLRFFDFTEDDEIFVNEISGNRWEMVDIMFPRDDHEWRLGGCQVCGG